MLFASFARTLRVASLGKVLAVHLALSLPKVVNFDQELLLLEQQRRTLHLETTDEWY